MRTSPIGRSSEAAGASTKFVTTPSGLTTITPTLSSHRDPLRFGDAAAEGGLTGEEPFAAGTNPMDSRDQGRVEHAVDGLRLDQRVGQVVLQSFEVGLEGTNPAIELALAQEVRKVRGK